MSEDFAEYEKRGHASPTAPITDSVMVPIPPQWTLYRLSTTPEERTAGDLPHTHYAIVRNPAEARFRFCFFYRGHWEDGGWPVEYALIRHLLTGLSLRDAQIDAWFREGATQAEQDNGKRETPCPYGYREPTACLWWLRGYTDVTRCARARRAETTLAHINADITPTASERKERTTL